MKPIFLLLVLLTTICTYASRKEKNGALLDRDCQRFGTRCGSCNFTYTLLYNESGMLGLWIQVTSEEIKKRPALEKLLTGKREIQLSEPFQLSEEDRTYLKLPRNLELKSGPCLLVFKNKCFYIKLH
ncbi:MAG: hypothetical protein JNM95_01440 [Chitinophagaceae bacterium]|nr:hypothetical protein [Chitinophagaceae bacterium]